MKKAIKQWLSVLLAVLLCVGMFPPAVSATTGSYTTWVDAGNAAVEGTDYAVSDGNYTVYTAKGLAYIANVVNDGDFLTGRMIALGNDIDLLDGDVIDYAQGTVNATNSWIPIAAIEDYLSPVSIFCGTFDGNGYSIKNLYMNTPDYHAGLFGYVYDATIQNVNIVGAQITAYIDIANAILAPYAIDTTVINCTTDSASSIIDSTNAFCQNLAGLIAYNAIDDGAVVFKDCINCASVTATKYGVIMAGIVAQTDGVIQNCKNYGTISGGDGVGGITGQCEPSEIKNCENHGSIIGTSCMIGGIIGAHDNRTVTIISQCYNTGSITGAYQVGGIAGYILDSARIEDCYNIGSVTGTSSTYGEVGGISGALFPNTAVNRCHSIGVLTSNTPETTGCIAGDSQGSVTNCAVLSGSTVAGWDSTNSTTGTVNNNVAFADFSTGEALQHLVNAGGSVWKQNIGVDLYPKFEMGYQLSFTTEPTAGGTISGGTDGIYPEGTQLTLTAAANADYYFVGWVKNGQYEDAVNPKNVVVSENVAYIALFASTAEKVTVTDDPDSQTVNAGDSVTFTIDAANATDYQWYTDASSIPGLTVDSDGKIVGATDTALTLQNVPVELTGNNFWCQASKSLPYGQKDAVDTQKALLTVNALTPSIPIRLRLDNFATTTGEFLDEAYYAREARAGDVVTLKVSTSDLGDQYGLDYRKITVKYEIEGATQLGTSYDYNNNPIFKDGIATDFMLNSGFNMMIAHVYYADIYVGAFEPFYCNIP